MRLATIVTPSGPRLHVRGRSGYVDVAAESGSPDLADRDGREYGPADLGPAIPQPTRILCLGVNYTEHALEGGREVPAFPETFVRGAGSVLAPYGDLVRPALTDRFDFEGELGIVIGAGGRYIPASKALDAIAGFVVLNDATARDWQRAGT